METEKKLFYTEKSEYEKVKLLKNGERSSVFVVRKKENGKRFLLRITDEKAEIYKKLLGISSKNLPEVIEVFEKEEKSLIVEEYVSGDTLFDLLRNGTFSEKEAVEFSGIPADDDLREGKPHRPDDPPLQEGR